MGSKNGTWLDGEKLQAGDSAEAFSGSKLRVEDMFIEIVFLGVLLTPFNSLLDLPV